MSQTHLANATENASRLQRPSPLPTASTSPSSTTRSTSFTPRTIESISSIPTSRAREFSSSHGAFIVMNGIRVPPSYVSSPPYTARSRVASSTPQSGIRAQDPYIVLAPPAPLHTGTSTPSGTIYDDMPPLVPQTPLVQEEDEDSNSLRSLLSVLESITRLENQERQYREQLTQFHRSLALVERLIDTTRGELSMEEDSDEELGTPAPNWPSTYPRESHRVPPQQQPQRGTIRGGVGRPIRNDDQLASESFQVFDLSDLIGRSHSHVQTVYSELGMQTDPMDGRTSRLGFSTDPAGLLSRQESNVILQGVTGGAFNLDFVFNASGASRRYYQEDEEENEDEEFTEDGLDVSQFNSAISALRLIYQNRRNHSHVRGSRDYAEDDDSENGDDLMQESRNGAPLFFEDGCSSVLENWLMTLPILDRNGDQVTDVAQAIDCGVGFGTPEGNGGIDLLWRGYDCNGNVRINDNGEEYVEIIEVNTVTRGCKPSGMSASQLGSASTSDHTRRAIEQSRDVGR
ncbi:UNVERIFIED_CONTAM: hypothetical protein HDU68_009760 [Siphonaria sp. JEL0065]|nr:hypothetical protein HDU68_009760 [Siphonaria sp. JEL0065]